MFFKSKLELKNILENSDTAIICLKNGEPLEDEIFSFEELQKTLKNCIIIEEYSIENIREIISLTNTKTSSPRFFIFKNAENLPEPSQNAALKLLEEPKDNYHFILFTTSPEALLSTIRSRAHLYIPTRKNKLDTPPDVEKEILKTAKELLVATPAKILDLADLLHKKKDTEKFPRREYVLEVLETTIELAEKSYYKTENEAFTRKINGLIAAYDGIKKNGIVRLQIIANLI